MDESLDHLRPWMPWATTSPSISTRVELLRTFRAKFDLGEDFVYAIFDRGESRVLGGTGLHLGAARRRGRSATGSTPIMSGRALRPRQPGR